MGRSADICDTPKFRTRPGCANAMDGKDIDASLPLGLEARDLEARLKNLTRAPGRDRRFAAICTRRSLFSSSIPDLYHTHVDRQNTDSDTHVRVFIRIGRIAGNRPCPVAHPRASAIFV